MHSVPAMLKPQMTESMINCNWNLSFIKHLNLKFNPQITAFLSLPDCLKKTHSNGHIERNALYILKRDVSAHCVTNFFFCKLSSKWSKISLEGNLSDRVSSHYKICRKYCIGQSLWQFTLSELFTCIRSQGGSISTI